MPPVPKRWRSSERLEESAHCKSSRTMRTGASALASSRAAATACDQEELFGVRLGLHRLLSREEDRRRPAAAGRAPRRGPEKALERGRLGVAHEVGEGTHPRQIGRVRSFGTLAEEHCDALAVCAVRRVGGQAGLAHPGFAGDQGDSQPSFGRRLLAQLGQQRQLGVAPGESEQSAGGIVGEAHREGYARRAVLPRRLPTHLDRRDRGGEALELEGPSGTNSSEV